MGSFSQNVHIWVSDISISPHAYPINSLFQWCHIFIRFIFLKEQSFSQLAIIVMITEKVSFLFPSEPFLDKQIHSSQASRLSTQTTLFLKIWSQTDKDYLKNCCKGISSASLLRTQAITMGSKSIKNYFLNF